MSANGNSAAESVQPRIDAFFRAAESVLVGQRRLLERLLIGLLTDGHILLEGVPGLAKTLAVRTVAQALRLKFHRVQFTPDLLPADVVGTQIYNPRSGEFSVKPGPVFANILLADEINRAPAKVQSALLEAMQERQVTVAGNRHRLPDPFFVLATQNPIEQEGTYPLPEAQQDRFMFTIRVDYPAEEEEFRIIEATTSAAKPKIERVVSAEELLAMQALVRQVPIAPYVIRYALKMARMTRPTGAAGEAPDPHVPDFVKKYVTWGAGPRAGQNLVLAGKARALLQGRTYVAIEDIRAMALPVLRHRVITNYNAEADRVTADDVVKRLLPLIPRERE